MADLTRAAMTTRHDAKTAKARKVKADRAAAYRLVDIRDGYRCRACGARAQEHHHIDGRGRTHSETTGAIVLLCRTCHDDRHVRRTLTIIGNADSALCFEQDGFVWHG